jgi:prepilin-type N-terminal cleavage/methylation domain-containing protein
MFKKLKENSSAFTIIEVMIVMAIAGLIIVAVLIAVPQLQRNQRNSARQNVASRIKTEIDNYSGNNNGKVPTNAADITGFNTRYLTGIAANIQDPKTGTAFTIAYTADTTVVAGAINANNGGIPAVGAIIYKDGVTCNGERLAAGSGRTYAMWTTLEGGAYYCLDNK